MASKKKPKKKAREYQRGTVGWLIQRLKEFPKDSCVLHGDHKDHYYEADTVVILPIREGFIDEKRGEKIVCIRAF